MPDDSKLPPPSGDSQRAEGYINQLIPLISDSKLKVTHTDLSKFDPSSLHDHYSLDLDEYQIEISHTKQPTTGRDSYVILFNNIKNVAEENTQKQILAYLIITDEQFKKIKDVADEQIETLKKVEEEKRFKVAMTPVDALIDKIAKGEVDVSKSPQPVPEIPKDEQSKNETKAKEENSKQEGIDEPTPPEEVMEPVSVKPRGEPESIPTQATPPTFETPPPPIQAKNQVSALAAAAAIPIVQEAPEPTSTHTFKSADQTPTPEPAPAEALPAWPTTPGQPITAPSTAQAQVAPQSEPIPASVSALGAAPAPAAPAATIEEVQAALKKAYEQSPPQPIPQEYRPGLGQMSQPQNQSALPQTNPQIDQQIDQAFKPANNLMLTQNSKTPEV